MPLLLIPVQGECMPCFRKCYIELHRQAALSTVSFNIDRFDGGNSTVKH